MTKRRDSKGRILKEGERQRPDGSYEYRYRGPDKIRRSVRSWRLVTTDKTPVGKVPKPSLRELEKQILKDLDDGIIGCDRTVIEQCERYTATKTGVKPTTETGYKTILNVIRKAPAFANKKISAVTLSDAKLFLIDLQKGKYGKKYGYSSIHSVRGVLRPAFQMAVDDDHIRKNPFEFQLHTVIVDDSHKREAISRSDERRFLKFIEGDEHFKEYYDAIYILFNTGLRISELCGLTLADIDIEKKQLRVDHQLQRMQNGTLYCQSPKTEYGERILPLDDKVVACFRSALDKRGKIITEPLVDGYAGFIWLNHRARKGLRPYVAMDYEHIFTHIVDAYNDMYRLQLPKITPHVCRHTYCSNKAKSGINPKVLQYLMGHSDIGITLNTYTHLGFEAAKEELQRLKNKEGENAFDRAKNRPGVNLSI